MQNESGPKTEGWEISQTEEEEAEGEESRDKEQTSRQKDETGLKSQKYLLDKCIQIKYYFHRSLIWPLFCNTKLIFQRHSLK